MSLRRRRDIWDLVVVGGGIAGLTAVGHATRLGLSTALFEAQPGCGGQVATIEVLDDWPATTPVSGYDLASALVAALPLEAVEIHHELVERVSIEGALIRVESEGRSLRAHRVLAATGARLLALDVPGESELRGKGVSQCAYCDGHFFRDEDVVVVGGGDSALQEALVLADSCRSVTIVTRSRLRAKAAYVEQALGKANLRFVWDSTIDAVRGVSGVTGVQVRNVKSGERSELACTGVFPFVGVSPETGFLPESVARDAGGLVLTDARCCTTEPSIFAVGALRAGYSGALVSAAGEAALAVSILASDLKAAVDGTK